MGSKQWEDIGAERGRETGRKYPEELTIVGLDVTEEYLLGRYPTDSRADENARAAIVACRDEKRLDPPPEHWINQFALGNPPPIECYRLPPYCRGKLWVVVFKGRHRTMAQRELNGRCKKKAERQKSDILLIPLRPEKMTRAEALIAQSGSNNFIPESLECRAARAIDMREARLGMEVIVTMLAQGGGQPVVDDLLAWGEVFPLLSAEAVRLANAGKLSLGRAKRLAKLQVEEQDAALQPKPRQAAPDGPRPASPARLRALLVEVESDPKISGSARTLLRVLSGEASPEDLSDGMFAAWNRASERLSSRPAIRFSGSGERGGESDAG